ncbi:MAG: FISUMP domain-containing protein, partial [Bacteroidota bacterium]
PKANITKANNYDIVTTIPIPNTVTITSSAVSNTIIQGTIVTFTANTSVFTNPTYQWYKNNAIIPSATLSTYQTNSLNNNDQISVIVKEFNSGTLITSNLVQYLDAGNPASYSGTGTVWNDLSGLGNNSTSFSNNISSGITNGITYFNFNGSTISAPIAQKSSRMTFNLWAYDVNTTGGMLFNAGPNLQGPDLFFTNFIDWNVWDSDENPFRSVGLGSGPEVLNSIKNEWHYYTVVVSGSDAKLYVDANLLGTAYINLMSRSVNSTNEFYIGSNIDGSYPWIGRIAAVHNYNSVLSQADILNNYNATRNGLTSYSSNAITTTVLIPTVAITAPLATLTSNCSGVASSPTTFNVTGSNLTSNVTVSAPTGFEIATVSNTSYVSSISLTPSISNTVSSTLYVRLVAGATIGVSGTISVASSGAVSQSRTISSTISTPAPAFAVAGPYIVCSEGTYAVSLTVPNSYNGWLSSAPSIASVNNSGFVTAISSSGSSNITFTDACGNSVSQTINIVSPSLSTVAIITDGQASYKFNNNPQGPLGSGNVVYMGYNGFDYSSTTRPTKPGFYRANNVSGSNAGSPTQFYIFRCTTCGTVSENNNLSSVRIGEQIWTDKNLDVTTYSDGTTIPQVTDPSEWAGLTTGAWCYYENNSANGTTYGKLYNWYAVAGIFDEASKTDISIRKKIAPAGWHVPSDAEWTILSDYLGGDDVAGGEMKTTGTTYWLSPNTDATNSSKFFALPGGLRPSFIGDFISIGMYGVWWSTTLIDSEYPIVRIIQNENSALARPRSSDVYKLFGMSVRLVKD